MKQVTNQLISQLTLWCKILRKSVMVTRLIKNFLVLTQPEKSLPCSHSLPVDLILGHLNTAHYFTPYFSKICFCYSSHCVTYFWDTVPYLEESNWKQKVNQRKRRRQELRTWRRRSS